MTRVLFPMPPTQAAATFSELCGVGHYQQHLLNRAERDVVRLLGASALESVWEFGARCQRDPELVAKVRGHTSILHPEVAPLLAKDMADYLIAYHILASTLEGIVTESLFGALPRTTHALVSMGASLQRFTGTELRTVLAMESIDDFGGMSRLGAGANPLWSRLSLGTIEEFNSCQRRAYHARLAIQPGGEQLLRRSAEGAAASYAGRLARVMTMTTLAAFRSCSAQDLRQLREIGRGQLGSRYRPLSIDTLTDRPVYTLEPVTGVKQLEPPRVLVDRFLALHHEAWKAMHGSVVGSSRESQSMRANEPFLRTMDAGRRATFHENLTRLAALTLPRELALLPDRVFAQIEQLCVNPSSQGGKLIIPDGTFLEKEGTLAVTTADVTTELTPIAVQIGLRDPEYTAEAEQLLRDVNCELLKADSRALAPLFSASDAFVDSGTARTHLHVVSEKLFLVASCREEILRTFACEVMSAAPEQHERYRSVLESDNPLAAIVSVLSAKKHDGFNAVRGERQRVIDEILSVVESLGMQPSQPVPYMTEHIASLDNETYRGIRRLVAQHQRDPQSQDFAARGGIVFDTYNKESLEQYLHAGNHLLVHRGIEGNSSQIDAFFLFGRPGYLSKEIDVRIMQSLEEMAIPQSRVSGIDILLVDSARPQGTYQRLIVRHILTSSLEGAQYRLGFVYEANAKHLEILKASGAIVLQSAGSYCGTVDGQIKVLSFPVLVRFADYQLPGGSMSR